MRRNSFVIALAALALSCGPHHGFGGGSAKVRVYTSIYPEVLTALQPVVESISGAKIEFVQGGSERIAKRLDGELAAPGGSSADILLTSDPSYYKKLGSATLVPYDSKEAARIPDALKDKDHLWATARLSAMVIGLSADVKTDKPVSFKDLESSEKTWKIAIGDPDFSGTNLLTAARLSSRHGWGFYRALAARKALVAGANGTVMLRLETATSDVGIVLLENLLASRAKGTKVGVVYPTDGAVIVPGPIALLPHAKDSDKARAVYDAILSAKAQQILVEKGFMYSADPAMKPPADAPALEKLLGGAALSSVYADVADRDQVKATFAKTFAR